ATPQAPARTSASHPRSRSANTSESAAVASVRSASGPSPQVVAAPRWLDSVAAGLQGLGYRGAAAGAPGRSPKALRSWTDACGAQTLRCRLRTRRWDPGVAGV